MALKISGVAAAFRVFIGLAPHELPLAISRSYDFSASTSYVEDLSGAQENGQIEWVQAVYVDNSLNGSPVSLFFASTQQTITLAPYQQSYIPVLSMNPPKVVVSSSGGITVNVSYLNFAVPADTWDSQIKPIQVQGNSGVDGSSTITTGGTAQNLFGGTIPTNGFFVTNPDPTNDIWINLNSTALANGSGSIRVGANGGYFATEPYLKPFHAISIVGAVTGQKFTAVRW